MNQKQMEVDQLPEIGSNIPLIGCKKLGQVPVTFYFDLGQSVAIISSNISNRL